MVLSFASNATHSGQQRIVRSLCPSGSRDCSPQGKLPGILLLLWCTKLCCRHRARQKVIDVKAVSRSKGACRPEWHQMALASPPQQQRPRLVQHPANPQAHYLVLASPHHAELATVADSNRSATAAPSAQQARCSAPAGKQQSQSQKVSQGLSKSVNAKVQRVLNKALLLRQTTLSQRPRQATQPAKAPGPASLCRGRHSAVGRQRLQTQAASDAVQDASASESVSQQVQAIRSSAHAVLRGLDWADSQLSCSTNLSAVSNSALMCSTGSSDEQNRTAEAVGQTSSAMVAAPLANAAELTKASCKNRQNAAWGSETATPAQLAGQVTPEQVVTTCQEMSQQQAERACICANGSSQCIRQAVVQQSKPQGCTPLSEAPGSDATWSDKGEGNGKHNCSPCSPLKQVGRRLAMHSVVGSQFCSICCTMSMHVVYTQANKCMDIQLFSLWQAAQG